MTDVLLGKPLLRSLGFDFDSHLNNVAAEIHNKSVQELTDNAQLSRLGYQVLVYGDVYDDPIELPSHIISGFGDDEPEYITA